ncbi:MAG: hypothetical protein COS14_13830 [Bacteroidetes bacterium CG02_land_8_20_14_3_00_31_25]|nr:MAG: hypothetical protein COS14_13830 [Bacteroidetes bacterium CG02_land_8_20_14_3_00_31_25]PIY02771.1 MAG: hypothetical protein COZ21_12425 [Bacteroidetes bacterium CG_4_10_14_3_um_filter_31_20]
MFKFIIDTQLPPKLANHLTNKGTDTIHTTFFNNGHLLKDKEIIDIAINEKRIIITKDNDFLDYFIIKGSPPKIILLECGNIRNNALLKLLDNKFDKIIKLLKNKNELIIIQKNNIIAY